MIESAVTLLPEPDSPTIATVSLRRDVERDVVDDRVPFAFDPERGGQIGNGQDRLAHVRILLWVVIRSRTAFERVSLSPMRRGEEDSSTHEKCE